MVWSSSECHQQKADRMQSIVGRYRALRLYHLWLAVLLTTGLCGIINLMAFSSTNANPSKYRGPHRAVDGKSVDPSILTETAVVAAARYSVDQPQHHPWHPPSSNKGYIAENFLPSIEQSRGKVGNVSFATTPYGEMPQVLLPDDGGAECNMASYLSVDQDRNKFSTTEADKLVQIFQPDWNLQLSRDNDTPWKIAAQWVSPTHVHPEHTPEMGAVLRRMATTSIEKVDMPDVGGSNFKLMVTLTGGQRALFKPKMHPRDYVHGIQNLCQLRDSHIGEIIGFHLSRILGFRKTPLAVGRTLDLHKDIIPVASPELLQRINIVTAHKSCVVGGLCTTDGQLEGGLLLMLPEDVGLRGHFYPWGRMCPAVMFHTFYLRSRINSTEDMCRLARGWRPLQNKTSLFLDLVDGAILQYLVLNSDRKLHMGTGKYSNFMAYIDNGKCFADPDANFIEILAPLYHCCRIRESTYRRLQSLENGTLSYVLDAVTKTDPVYPLLTSRHLQAMDRRLHKALAHIHFCICKHGRHNVLIDV